MKDNISNRIVFLLLYASKKNYNIKSWGLYVCVGALCKRDSYFSKVQRSYAADFSGAGIQPQLVPNIHLLTAAVCRLEKSHLARTYCVVKRATACMLYVFLDKSALVLYNLREIPAWRD